MPSKPSYLVNSFSAAIATVGVLSFIYPESARDVILNALHTGKNMRDSAIQIMDTDNDSCVTSIFMASEHCMSAGAYLKNIISETPLSQEDVRKLKSFIGGERTASPFDYQI